MRSRIASGRALQWDPLPGPQTQAFESLADIIGYGGAAGGGKTDLMLGLALRKHQRSLILRREKTQARDIWERLLQIVGSLGHPNENYLTIRNLPGGRQVELGGMKDPGDWKTYQGRPRDLYAFDELTEFMESQFRTLIAWNRTTDPQQHCQVVAAFNPPTTADGEWVIRYFGPWLDAHHPHPAEPGELRWYAMVQGEEIECESGEPFHQAGEQIIPRSRTFFPARVTDNPLLMETGYVATLQALPEPLRSQMLYGNFEIGMGDNPWQVIPTAWVRAAQERWRQRSKPTDVSLTAVGGDLARGGQDQTVLARRYGNWYAPLEKHPGVSTPDGPAAARLFLSALTEGGYANLDGIGIGASVYDLCCQQGAQVNSVIFSAAAPGKDRTGTLSFVNLRAWAYWSLRDALDPERGDELALPPDPEVIADLCAPRWMMRASGVQVESKEEIVKRLGRSPDCGDAVVLALIDTRKTRAWGVW